MFFYFYDTFVTDRAYASILTAVESRVIELGINGRVEKLTPLRNMKELLEDGIKHGAHTIVVVGNDTTFVRALSIIATHAVVLGYIPFPGATALGTICGLGSGTAACDVLSRRIIAQMNLAKVNQSYFLGSLAVNHAKGIAIECDDCYTITPQADDTDVLIENFGSISKPPEPNQTYEKHAKLQLQIQPVKIKKGLFAKNIVPLLPTRASANKITLTHSDQPLTAVIDGEIKLKTPLTIALKPKQLKMIVGKERLIR